MKDEGGGGGEGGGWTRYVEVWVGLGLWRGRPVTAPDAVNESMSGRTSSTPAWCLHSGQRYTTYTIGET